MYIFEYETSRLSIQKEPKTRRTRFAGDEANFTENLPSLSTALSNISVVSFCSINKRT